MKPRSGDVLERNVARLVQRSYVPVLPRPAFREALAETWSREVRRRARGAGTPIDTAPRGPRRVLRYVALVAAALLVAWLGVDAWRRLGTAPGPAVSPTRAPQERVAEAPRAPSPPRPAGGADTAAPVERPPAEGERSPVEREALAVVEPAPSAPPATHAARAGIAGSVLGADGEPLTEFRIALLRELSSTEYQTARTRDFRAEDGTFAWEDAGSGPHEVFAWSEGHAIASLGPVELSAAAARPEVVARLTRGGTVRGFVVDARTGLGVPDALVVAERDVPQSVLPLHGLVDEVWLPSSCAARSRADGSFELPHVSSGEHVLRATATGFAPRWSGPIEVVEGGTASDVVLELGVGGTVEGHVVRSDGTPRAGAVVVVTLMDLGAHPQNNFAIAVSGADGAYRVDDLPDEPLLAILTQSERGRPLVEPVRVAPGETARVDFGEPTSDARVVGRLRWSDGSPVARQAVALLDDAAATGRRVTLDFDATHTDDAGGFRFAGLAPGRYWLYYVDQRGTTIRSIGEVEARIADARPFELELEGLAVRGRVVDGRNGEPVGEVLVAVAHLPDGPGEPLRIAGNAVTAADGSFVVEPLNTGRYVLGAYPAPPSEPSGGAPLAIAYSEEILLDASSRERDVELALGEGVRLTVLLETGAGRPVDEAVLVVRREGGPSDVVDSSAEGAAGRHALALAPGRYTLEALTDTGSSDPVPITLAPRTPHEVRLVLRGRNPDAGPTGETPADDAGR